MLRQDTLNESIHTFSHLIAEGKRKKAIKALRALSAHRDQKLVNRETKLSDTISRTPHDLLGVARDGKRLLRSHKKANQADRLVRTLTKEDVEDLAHIIENLDEWEFDALLNELTMKTLSSYKDRSQGIRRLAGQASRQNLKGRVKARLGSYRNRV